MYFISPSTADPTEHIRVRKQKGPLVIKTHLPFELLPTEINTRVKKPKVITFNYLLITKICNPFYLGDLHNT
jgi:hypothetical protein